MNFDNRLLFVQKDDKSGSPPILVESQKEAMKYNKNKYGVFYTVNGFKSKRRKSEEMSDFLAWAIDIDNIDKTIQKNNILSFSLQPSFVIESKNGYHVHWLSKDGKHDKHKEIMKRLVRRFSADERAKDKARYLRMPNFYHWKDQNDPFMVKFVVDKPTNKYTQEQMLNALPEVKIPKRTIKYDETNTDYDNMKALEILSGKPEVSCETFTFRKNSNGYQIFVNGKSSSSWIDNNGNIGSHSKGGPTWIQWLKYYGYDYKEAKKIGEKYAIL
jgi:hypothetical protein